MKVKELIEELKNYNQEAEVLGRYSFTNHQTCGNNDGGYCYCSSEERTGEISISQAKSSPKKHVIVFLDCDF